MKKRIPLLVFFLPLVLSPVLSYGSPKPIDFSRHEGVSGITASVQYKPALPYFSRFLLEDDKGKALKTFAAKKEGTAPNVSEKNSFVESRYAPRYENSVGKFSGSLGYSAGLFRFEAEGIYQEFTVDKANFSNEANAKTFAMSKVTTPTGGAATQASSTSAATSTNSLPDYYVTAVNEGVTVTSLVGNVCYDIMPGESKFSPHVCGGAGLSFIKFLGVTDRRVSYQAKLGFQYFLSSRSAMFASAYAHKISNNKFVRIPVSHQYKKAASSGGSSGSSSSSTEAPAIEHLYPSANLETAYFGIECGIRLIFSL